MAFSRSKAGFVGAVVVLIGVGAFLLNKGKSPDQQASDVFRALRNSDWSLLYENSVGPSAREKDCSSAQYVAFMKERSAGFEEVLRGAGEPSLLASTDRVRLYELRLAKTGDGRTQRVLVDVIKTPKGWLVDDSLFAVRFNPGRMPLQEVGRKLVKTMRSVSIRRFYDTSQGTEVTPESVEAALSSGNPKMGWWVRSKNPREYDW